MICCLSHQDKKVIPGDSGRYWWCLSLGVSVRASRHRHLQGGRNKLKATWPHQSRSSAPSRRPRRRRGRASSGLPWQQNQWLKSGSRRSRGNSRNARRRWRCSRRSAANGDRVRALRLLGLRARASGIGRLGNPRQAGISGE